MKPGRRYLRQCNYCPKLNDLLSQGRLCWPCIRGAVTGKNGALNKMSSEFDKTYMGQLRKLVGNKRLIVPGVRAVIIDDKGRILLIHRKDSGRWGMPAGAMELGESVLDALKREVMEETGLIVLEATPIGIYSHSRYSFQYPNGDKIQSFALVFLVDEWDGELVGETDETLRAGFFPLDDLPDLHEVYAETLEDLKNYNGTFIVK